MIIFILELGIILIFHLLDCIVTVSLASLMKLCRIKGTTRLQTN